jgi:hypothetical protein
MASAALVAAALGAPVTGLAQDPGTPTTTTAPEPPPTPTTTEPPPPQTVPEPAPTVTEPAPDPVAPAPDPAPAAPAPAAPAADAPPLFLPDLPRTSVTPPVSTETPEGASASDALGTNRGDDPPAGANGGGGGAGDLGTLLPATGAADVPSFFIDSFGVPPFLLPIYQAAGIEYGVPWQVLAAINAVETDYGRDLAVSSAGALGWMQFLPATFARFGVDGSGDGRADPYNPVDAIFSAAGYLHAAGADRDLAAAIFAYNHSASYVASVLSRARLLGGLPADLVSALSGLAQGRPPVLGAAEALGGDGPATTLRLRTKPAAAVVAVADGVVVRIGHDSRLGRYLQLRDVFGNTYTYGALGATARRYPVLAHEPRRPAPPAPPRAVRASGTLPALASTNWKAVAARRARPATKAAAAAVPLSAYDRRLLGGVAARDVRYRPLRTGARVIAGTILAHTDAASGRLAFEIRPAGGRAPQIQPRPVVAGWKLLRESAHGTPLLGGAAPAGIGRVLLLDKRELQREVLADDHIAIYPCGREDIRAGRIDRRVLATLKFLAMSGLHPTVSSLQCGHGLLTSAGEDDHPAGAAVDIAAVNGVPIAGNQGPGSIAEATIKRLLALQGALRPQRIISLNAVGGADNTLAMPDHADHIHIGFAASGAGTTLKARNSDGVVPASSWRRLSQRLSRIANPSVAATPSPAARVSPPAGRP